jgi:chromosome transmission fidelity protein 4
VPNNKVSLLEQPLQPAPFAHDLDSEAPIDTRKELSSGLTDLPSVQRRRRGTPDTLDEILGPALAEEDDFVSDDDGAGYLDEVNGFGKRSNGHLDPIDGFRNKRRTASGAWQPSLHESFQPGSTPWKGNRRYLCKVYSICLGFE